MYEFDENDFYTPGNRISAPRQGINLREMAAILIQSAFRGMKVRKRIKKRFKMHRHRSKLAKELWSTEETYRDALQLMMSSIYEPLMWNAQHSGNPTVPQEELHAIFSNIEAIFNLSVELCELFQGRVERWYCNQTIGDIFCKFGAFLKIYKVYCSNFETSNNKMREVEGTEKFVQFWEPIRSLHGVGTLGSFLIMPVQRIPRYVLLLQDMIKSTWEGHPDLDNLVTALEMVREIGGQVDTGMEIMQQSIEMSEGQRFFGSFVQVVEPTRSFIRRGKVTLLVQPQSTREGEVWLWLFNDLLIVSEEVIVGKNVRNALKESNQSTTNNSEFKSNQDTIATSTGEIHNYLYHIHFPTNVVSSSTPCFIQCNDDMEFLRGIFRLITPHLSLTFMSNDKNVWESILSDILPTISSHRELISKDRMMSYDEDGDDENEDSLFRDYGTSCGYTEIKVIGSTTRQDEKGKFYTAYIVDMNDGQRKKRLFKRYSEFFDLNVKMKEHIAHHFSTNSSTVIQSFPPLPPKKLIHSNRDVELRSVCFSSFLQQLSLNPHTSQSNPFTSFLSSGGESKANRPQIKKESSSLKSILKSKNKKFGSFLKGIVAKTGSLSGGDEMTDTSMNYNPMSPMDTTSSLSTMMNGGGTISTVGSYSTSITNQRSFKVYSCTGVCLEYTWNADYENPNFYSTSNAPQLTAQEVIRRVLEVCGLARNSDRDLIDDGWRLILLPSSHLFISHLSSSEPSTDQSDMNNFSALFSDESNIGGDEVSEEEVCNLFDTFDDVWEEVWAYQRRNYGSSPSDDRLSNSHTLAQTSSSSSLFDSYEICGLIKRVKYLRTPSEVERCEENEIYANLLMHQIHRSMTLSHLPYPPFISYPLLLSSLFVQATKGRYNRNKGEMLLKSMRHGEEGMKLLLPYVMGDHIISSHQMSRMYGGISSPDSSSSSKHSGLLNQMAGGIVLSQYALDETYTSYTNKRGDMKLWCVKVKPNSSSSGDLKDFLFQGMYQEEEKLWKRVVKLCTSPSYGSSSTANQDVGSLVNTSCLLYLCGQLPPLMSGWVNKKARGMRGSGSSHKNWKRRWMVILENTVLIYFKTRPCITSTYSALSDKLFACWRENKALTPHESSIHFLKHTLYPVSTLSPTTTTSDETMNRTTGGFGRNPYGRGTEEEKRGGSEFRDKFEGFDDENGEEDELSKKEVVNCYFEAMKAVKFKVAWARTKANQRIWSEACITSHFDHIHTSNAITSSSSHSKSSSSLYPLTLSISPYYLFFSTSENMDQFDGLTSNHLIGFVPRRRVHCFRGRVGDIVIELNDFDEEIVLDTIIPFDLVHVYEMLEPPASENVSNSNQRLDGLLESKANVPTKRRQFSLSKNRSLRSFSTEMSIEDVMWKGSSQQQQQQQQGGDNHPLTQEELDARRMSSQRILRISTSIDRGELEGKLNTSNMSSNNNNSRGGSGSGRFSNIVVPISSSKSSSTSNLNNGNPPTNQPMLNQSHSTGHPPPIPLPTSPSSSHLLNQSDSSPPPLRRVGRSGSILVTKDVSKEQKKRRKSMRLEDGETLAVDGDDHQFQQQQSTQQYTNPSQDQKQKPPPTSSGPPPIPIPTSSSRPTPPTNLPPNLPTITPKQEPSSDFKYPFNNSDLNSNLPNRPSSIRQTTMYGGTVNSDEESTFEDNNNQNNNQDFTPPTHPRLKGHFRSPLGQKAKRRGTETKKMDGGKGGGGIGDVGGFGAKKKLVTIQKQMSDIKIPEPQIPSSQPKKAVLPFLSNNNKNKQDSGRKSAKKRVVVVPSSKKFPRQQPPPLVTRHSEVKLTPISSSDPSLAKKSSLPPQLIKSSPPPPLTNQTPPHLALTKKKASPPPLATRSKVAPFSQSQGGGPPQFKLPPVQTGSNSSPIRPISPLRNELKSHNHQTSSPSKPTFQTKRTPPPLRTKPSSNSSRPTPPSFHPSLVTKKSIQSGGMNKFSGSQPTSGGGGPPPIPSIQQQQQQHQRLPSQIRYQTPNSSSSSSGPSQIPMRSPLSKGGPPPVPRSSKPSSSKPPPIPFGGRR